MTAYIAIALLVGITLVLWRLNANITAKEPRPGDDARVVDARVVGAGEARP